MNKILVSARELIQISSLGISYQISKSSRDHILDLLIEISEEDLNLIKLTYSEVAIHECH